MISLFLWTRGPLPGILHRADCQIAPRQRLFVAHHLRGSSLGDDASSFAAGARSQVDEPIGAGHDVEIVFDDEDAVSLVPQVLQSFEESPRVTRVQADGRFVEDVADADQPGAQATGDSRPLKFPSRKGLRDPVERQIVDADLTEIFQPTMDFRKDALGDKAGRDRE